MAKAPDFFNEQAAQGYDERNQRLADISGCLHFLITLALKRLPADAQVLCVGAGTGAEILPLAKAYPEWRFVALEPSRAMLDICRQRLGAAGVADRCEFVHGYAQDLPAEPSFDAALSILVGHFVKRKERVDFFQQMANRLKPGGYLVNAEISFDLESPQFPAMLRNWKSVQELMGATPESLATLPKVLWETLTVLPPLDVERFMRLGGITQPVKFFQAFMIGGWYGKKD